MPDSFPQNVDNTQGILIYRNEVARTCSSLPSPVSSNPHILFRFLSASVYIAADSKASMAIPTVQRHYWIFSADPHHYHWDTLFVKGKEMWHGAGSKPDAIRALKQVRKGDRVLSYHAAPERSLYSIPDVPPTPYTYPPSSNRQTLLPALP